MLASWVCYISHHRLPRGSSWPPLEQLAYPKAIRAALGLRLIHTGLSYLLGSLNCFVLWVPQDDKAYGPILKIMFINTPT